MVVKQKKQISNKKYTRSQIEDYLFNIEDEINDLWSYMDALGEEGIEDIPMPFNSLIGLRLAKVEGILNAATDCAKCTIFDQVFWRTE